MIKSGVIEKNETWSGAITVRGDVVIPEKVSVRVTPGTRIKFESRSDFESGEKREAVEALTLPVPGRKVDASRPYIVVRGVFEAYGEAKDRVVIGNEGWGGGEYFFLTEKSSA